MVDRLPARVSRLFAGPAGRGTDDRADSGRSVSVVSNKYWKYSGTPNDPTTDRWRAISVTHGTQLLSSDCGNYPTTRLTSLVPAAACVASASRVRPFSRPRHAQPAGRVLGRPSASRLRSRIRLSPSRRWLGAVSPSGRRRARIRRLRRSPPSAPSSNDGGTRFYILRTRTRPDGTSIPPTFKCAKTQFIIHISHSNTSLSSWTADARHIGHTVSYSRPTTSIFSSCPHNWPSHNDPPARFSRSEEFAPCFGLRIISDCFNIRIDNTHWRCTRCHRLFTASKRHYFSN